MMRPNDFWHFCHASIHTAETAIEKENGTVQARVARLAFLRPNFKNLTFLRVVWHEKMVFGMYVIVWHFFGLF